jgi:glucose-6-phosphate dehydrogenase assembly protein OpcA
MPTAYKVLGQVAPAATTDTTLYTVPSATETVVSTIVVANRAATAATFRIAIRPNAATLANQHYIAFDVTVAGNDSTTLTLGITIDAADVITVRGSTANLSFNAFGSEITA